MRLSDAVESNVSKDDTYSTEERVRAKKQGTQNPVGKGC